MKKESSLNRNIDSIYAHIFDQIEARDLREQLNSFRDRILGRFFKSIQQREEERFKETSQTEIEFLEKINANLEDFEKDLSPQKIRERVQKDGRKISDEEIQRIGSSKALELLFSAIDNNMESKKVFKYIIETVSSKYSLRPEQINKLKAFVIDYMIHREQVNLLYTSFAGNIESIASFIYGPDILKEKGIEIRKGKYGLEIFTTQDIIHKYIMRKPVPGVSLSYISNILNKLPIGFERPGGIINFIFIARDSNKASEEIIVPHERQHARYIYMNKQSKTVVDTETIKIPNESMINELAIREGNLNLTNYYVDYIKFLRTHMDSLFRDEFLAQVSGYKDEEMAVGVSHLFMNYNYRSYFKPHYANFLESNTSKKGIRKDLLKGIETIAYGDYEESLQKQCLLVLELILKNPQKKDFFITYFSEIGIFDWEAEASKFDF